MKQHIINAKELRASLPEIVRAVRQGDRFTVLYRSRPAFQIIGAEDNHNMKCPLKEDPLFQAGAVVIPPARKSPNSKAEKVRQ